MNKRAEMYAVGGVSLPRPFKIQRLGHFGIWSRDLEASRSFYVDTLGLRMTDTMSIPAPNGSYQQIFTSHGSDHHSFVIGDARFAQSIDDSYARGVTVNQLSFQVGTLQEVADAQAYFFANDIRMQRGGRDSPGSNWAVYMYDPDGMRTELFYGIEQIGWDRRSKPEALRYLGAFELPMLPQASEETELLLATQNNLDLTNGTHSVDSLRDPGYDVGGIRLPRPFKVTGVGPAKFFVDDVVASEEFYIGELGFRRSEEVTFEGHRTVFLRNSTDHHTIGLFPIELRARLGFDVRTKLMSFGFQVGSYQQLRDARDYLRERGASFVDVPQALHPGIDYCVHAADPDGHLICLYYSMEQLGWDGRPRPAAERIHVTNPWPATIVPQSDTYDDQRFLGPLG